MLELNLDPMRRTAVAIAEAAGHLLADAWSRETGVWIKNGHEVVTDADLSSDKHIRDAIMREFPGHRIISEETWDGWRDDLIDGPVWIVDPLDGSVNFVHRLPYFAVALAFAVDGVVQLGVVHAPIMRMTFEATRGGGARLGESELKASEPASLGEALVSTGLPHDRRALDGVIRRIEALASKCRDVRRMGSPTLDICLVGAGILDAHAESLAPWDVAAAGLIATEAGARRGNLLPQSFPLPPDLAGTGVIVAAPSIYDALYRLLEEADQREHPPQTIT